MPAPFDTSKPADDDPASDVAGGRDLYLDDIVQGWGVFVERDHGARAALADFLAYSRRDHARIATERTAGYHVTTAAVPAEDDYEVAGMTRCGSLVVLAEHASWARMLWAAIARGA